MNKINTLSATESQYQSQTRLLGIQSQRHSLTVKTHHSWVFQEQPENNNTERSPTDAKKCEVIPNHISFNINSPVERLGPMLALWSDLSSKIIVSVIFFQISVEEHISVVHVGEIAVALRSSFAMDMKRWRNWLLDRYVMIPWHDAFSKPWKWLEINVENQQSWEIYHSGYMVALKTKMLDVRRRLNLDDHPFPSIYTIEWNFKPPLETPNKEELTSITYL